jgi:hypothetical protein
MFVLVFVYVGCWLGDTYGIKCAKNRFPIGLMFMKAFAGIWSYFVLRVLKSQNEMLQVRSGSVKSIVKNSKTLLLDNKKKEFNPKEM